MNLSLADLALADTLFFPNDLESALHRRNVDPASTAELVSFYKSNRHRTFLGLFKEYSPSELTAVLEDIFQNEFIASVKNKGHAPIA